MSNVLREPGAKYLDFSEMTSSCDFPGVDAGVSKRHEFRPVTAP